MKLELYNTTDRVKQIPKYRYAGKFTLQPKSAVDIEDFMAEFFAPYAQSGVVVRAKVDAVVDEKVEEVVKPEKVEEPDKVEEPVKVEEHTVEEKVETVEETADTEKTKEKKYTKESLSEMNMNDLRDLASSIGIDTNNIRKKNTLIDAILAV